MTSKLIRKKMDSLIDRQNTALTTGAQNMQTPLERVIDTLTRTKGDKVMLDVKDVKLLLIERRAFQDYIIRENTKVNHGR